MRATSAHRCARSTEGGGSAGLAEGIVPSRRVAARSTAAGSRRVARVATAEEVEGRMKVGVLTGGGDCPGLNAVIRAVVRKAEQVHGDQVLGFRDGWKGVLEASTMPLDVAAMRGTLPRGGTVLGTSRTNPYKVDGGVERCKQTLYELGVDALIAIGGGGTPGGAHKIYAGGIHPVGVPQTIDNHPSPPPVTFGFCTPVEVATEANDRPPTTA